jgi:cytochrome c oxidase subunit IV
MAQETEQQHPISIYFWIWGLLFVLSFFSYMVDYLNFQGGVRWALILIFMFLKAGFIVAIFMHMAWERLALKFAILLPPIALLVFVLLMTFEADYTFLTRIVFFGEGAALPVHH